MKYYLHRIVNWYPEWSIPLLDKMNLISYGGAALASRSDFVSKHQHHWPGVRDTVKHEWPGSRWGGQLERFLAMESGDWVVVPRARAFDVYEVADDARLVPADIEDELASLEIWQERNAAIRDRLLVERSEAGEHKPNLGFFRWVKPVEQGVPRDGYADAALTKRLKTRWANVEITDLRQSVKDAVRAYKSKDPINLRDRIKKECAGRVLQTILDKSSDMQFERLIKSYLEAQGAIADIPPKNEAEKEDGADADVVATFNSLKLIVYVQAKFHEGESDDWAVKQIMSYRDSMSAPIEEYTCAAWVISTAERFSSDCQKMAESANVRLINGIEFAGMLLDAGVEHL